MSLRYGLPPLATSKLEDVLWAGVAFRDALSRRVAQRNIASALAGLEIGDPVDDPPAKRARVESDNEEEGEEEPLRDFKGLPATENETPSTAWIGDGRIS